MWSRLVLPRDGCDCCCTLSVKSVGYHYLLISIAIRNRKFQGFFYRKENLITFLALISFFIGRISLSIALDVCFENVCVFVNCSENINHKSRETYSMFWGISVWVCVCVVTVLISWAVFLSIRINNLCFFSFIFSNFTFLYTKLNFNPYE